MPKEKVETKKFNLQKPLVFAIALILWSILEYTTNGDTMWFWLSFVLSAIIILPNLIWLKKGWGKVFGIPYIITMLKTKRFVQTIHNLAKHAKFLEKLSILGLFVGFGLTGIDYWVARGQGGIRRIIILIIGAISLGLIFNYTLSILFSVPALESLWLFGLISFVLLGFGGLSLAFMLGYGVIAINAFFIGEQICPSVAPVIPGVPIPGMGVVIPLIAWISLGLILIIHEFSHGIMLSYYKEKIKSVGLILFGIIPMGAFVEQDDKTFNKKDDKKQLLVLSAGPTSNLFTMIIGIIILLVFMQLITPLTPMINSEFEKTYHGIQIAGVEDEVSLCGIIEVAPAKDKLMVGDEVVALNGVDINSIYSLNTVFRDVNDLMVFGVLRNGTDVNVEIMPVLFEGLGVKRIGVIFEPIKTGYEPKMEIQILSFLINSFNSIVIFFIILSFAVGMFNFLPSNPLDGGRIAQIMLLPYFGFMKFNSKEETQKFIGRLFIWLFIISILVNLLPYFTMFF